MLSKQQICSSSANYPFVLFYKGNYKESPTLNIIDIIEKNLLFSVKNSSIKTFVYLMIEALQNIERYSAHVSEAEDSVYIYSDGTFFRLFSQNMIENDKIPSLKQKLDELTTKSQEEINSIYKESLESGEKTEKGAGLGLIDIIRKTKNNLFYSFDKKNETYSTYSLSFAIPIDKKSDVVATNFQETKNTLESLQEMFKNNRSTLFYGGDFSNNFIFSLLDLLKTTKKDELNSVSKKTHHILIELIQNVKKHGYKPNGTVCGQMFIEWKKGEMDITTYNYVTVDDEKKVSDKLDKLNAASMEDLVEYSKKQLVDLSQTNGLGLIDVALFIAPEKINYAITKKDTTASELILSTKVKYE